MDDNREFEDCLAAIIALNRRATANDTVLSCVRWLKACGHDFAGDDLLKHFDEVVNPEEE